MLIFMKLSATHAFNCIVLMIKFGRTSCEDIPLALVCDYKLSLYNIVTVTANKH